jgi:hypothetical protein
MLFLEGRIMRHGVLIGLVALLALPAMALYTVDVGSDPMGYTNEGWSDPWYGNGSNYGGMPADDPFRMVWYEGDENWAKVVFPEAIDAVRIYYLDGQADDSFTITVSNGAGEDWGSVTTVPGGGETWLWSPWFTGTPGDTLKITATGDQWTGFATYGQLAVDQIEASPIPAPGALVLGSLGVGIVGWLRRRRAA